MENFNELLQKYADFIVRVGVNPQPGQTLIINCPLEGAPLARLCVRSAYEAGARDVQVNWQDDAVTRIRMELGSEDALTDHKGWQLRRYLDYAESEGGVCVLHLIADDPELFAGLDGAKISRVNSANRSFMQPWREYTMNDRVQWSIAALPAEPWAKKMFPELDTAAAIEAQWKLIFDTCRVTGGDPVGEWQKHLNRLNELGAKMNALDLESVHFESANGTDLTVGLAEQAVWESAGSKNEKGVPFLPNIPTEEVFTAPHKDKVDGIVYGTKPYVFNGQLIKNFHVTFKDGKVVEHGADEGADLLGQLLDTDEGARHIGEVALVPASSPINRSGKLFYNTLFDENAACHIAFGDSYPGTTVGGTGLTREQLALLPAEQVAGVSRAQLLLAVYTRASEQLDTWLKNDKASYADVAQRLERLADSVRQELERSVDRDSAAKALDHYCGGSVEVLISSIGTVKPVMPPTEAAAAKTRLQRARTAYNALTASQKALVPNYASLQEGETAYRTYESNYAAAKAAESLISAIGTVTADSGDAIRKAQEAYDALTAEQKQLVDARLVQQMETAAAQYRQLLAQSAENGGETPSADETMSDGVKPADRMQPTDQTRPEQAQPFDWSLVWLGGGILASAAAIALILRWLAAVRRTEKKNKA